MTTRPPPDRPARPDLAMPLPWPPPYPPYEGRPSMSGPVSRRRRPYRIGVLVVTLAVLGGVGYALVGPSGGRCGGLPWCTAPTVLPAADRSAVPPVTTPATPPVPIAAASVPSPAPMSVIVPAPAPASLPRPAPKPAVKAPAVKGKKKQPLKRKPADGVRAAEGSSDDSDSSRDESDASRHESDASRDDSDASGDDSDSSGGDSSGGDSSDGDSSDGDGGPCDCAD